MLSEDFRMTYCRLWQSLIERDLPAIKRHCEELNAGQLHRLLASMVCARAWDNIATGIDQAPRSQNEVHRSYMNNHLYKECHTAQEKDLEKRKRKKEDTRAHHNTIPLHTMCTCTCMFNSPTHNMYMHLYVQCTCTYVCTAIHL